MVDIINGDCRDVLKTLPSGSVNCCVTSPPYFGLRDYGHAGQIGLEQTPDAYVAQLVAVFREVRRVLRDDGTLWLNLGDSYAANPGQRKETDKAGPKQLTKRGSTGSPSRDIAGLSAKNLIGIPWRVAFALQADGWYLRQDIIWSKPNPMPESVTDRCTKSHEYIFLLSKSARYYYDAEAIKEESVTDDPRRPYGSKGAWDLDGRPEEQRPNGKLRAPANVKRGGFNGKTNEIPGREAFRSFTETRNKRDVWTVATQPYKGAHFATFPPALILPCILAGCPSGGTVLDCFGGSGTTGEVAAGNGRNAVIVELNPSYCTLATNRGGLFCQQGIA
jgi:DNA modification methylase